jgi:CheY-like chemotaxis protein
MQKAGRVMDQVNKRMDSGRSQESLSLLESTIAQLKQYGPADKVEEAVQRLEQLRALIQADAFSLEERKSNKYRSSSYRHMSSSELWSMRERSPSFKKRKAAEAKTVWLVNDDEYVRKSIGIILEHGVPESRLSNFTRSVSAWEALALSKPDLLIMADAMVQMRGREIAEQLFARGDTFPIIVTSAWDGTQEWVDVLATKGMNIKLINLPVTPDVIWDMTRSALGLSPRPNAST